MKYIYNTYILIDQYLPVVDATPRTDTDGHQLIFPPVANTEVSDGVSHFFGRPLVQAIRDDPRISKLK